MSTVAWQQVWSLFEETLGQPSGERHDYLDRACGGDGLLREAVDRMLEADRKANNLLDRPVVCRPEPQDPVNTATASPGTTALGLPTETIGPYRLLRKIGQGGMSTVYLAVRSDDTFRRRVVVKLIRRGLESAAMIHRLRVERQILASLSHPHIARLYDGGATNEGLPYFVMEYVEGESIECYCARNRLPVAERVALFLKVCDAVRYAHQNLIVHRDLKPANIMVTSDGEPKLLDFGIAKMLNPERSSETAESTATWQIALTPSYASPEQIRGKRITTASDVYSLGVVLYRLLTGKLPFDFKGLSPTEMERLVTRTEPSKPSTATAQGSERASTERSTTGRRDRQRELEGDLDAVVLKALRSLPIERYPSVEQLAADLDRHRNGLPVHARRSTWRYRASKFIRRHRVSVVAGAVFATTLAGLGSVIVWQSAQVVRKHDQMLRESTKKDQVQTLVLDLFERVQPDAATSVLETLERSAPLFSMNTESRPELRAEFLHTTGSIRAVIGDYEQAAAEFEEALALRRQLPGEPRIGSIETGTALAGVYANLGNLTRAETLIHEAISAARLVGEASGSRAILVPPLAKLALLRIYREQFQAAKEPALEAWELIQQVSVAPEAKIDLLECLGFLQAAEGDYAKAEARYQEAVDIRRQNTGENDPEQIHTLVHLALMHHRLAKHDQASKTYHRIVSLQDSLGTNVPDLVTTFNMARLHQAQGDFVQAEALLRQILADAATNLSKRYFILPTELALANVRLAQGDTAGVEADLRRIIVDATRQLGPDHWRIAEGKSLLGASISAQGRLERAERLLIDSYRHLLGSAKARYQDEALERLRQHLDRAGRTHEIAAYEQLRKTPSRLPI